MNGRKVNEVFSLLMNFLSNCMKLFHSRMVGTSLVCSTSCSHLPLIHRKSWRVVVNMSQGMGFSMRKSSMVICCNALILLPSKAAPELPAGPLLSGMRGRFQHLDFRGCMESVGWCNTFHTFHDVAGIPTIESRYIEVPIIESVLSKRFIWNRLLQVVEGEELKLLSVVVRGTQSQLRWKGLPSSLIRIFCTWTEWCWSELGIWHIEDEQQQ